MSYFWWELTAKASCFSREIPNLSATFSDVILKQTFSFVGQVFVGQVLVGFKQVLARLTPWG